jgi:hypothetical protein
MKADVGLYGGFAGNEAARGERDWVKQITVLDGGTNGVVVALSGGGEQTAIDGFTICNGVGAGIRIHDSAGLVAHNVVRDNLGRSYGAGIFVRNTNSTAVLRIEDNVIMYNYAYDGGGIFCMDASPRVVRNVIAWNAAQQNGGGLSCWRNASPTIANNTFWANAASLVEGGQAVPIGGGAIFATADDLDGRPHPTARSEPVIVGNVIVANGGEHGGGLAVIDSNGGVPVVVNNTIVANSGSGIFWGSSSLPLVALRPVLRNNLVAFNPYGLECAPGTPTDAMIEFNCVYGNELQGQLGNYRGLADRTGTSGNISVEPRLVNYRFGELHLQPGSPCIDAGIAIDGVAHWPDIDGQDRVIGAAMDIGADESDGTARELVPPVYHVLATGDDNLDGLTWATAKRTVQAAINRARIGGGEVWVGSGTYMERIWVPAFVYLYGGFAGTESNRAGRDPAKHLTILDGGGVHGVVTSRFGGYLVSVVDGFTIRNGGVYTGGAGLSQYGVGGVGGGVYIGVSSPIISNNLITSNSLAQDNTPVFPQPPSYGAGVFCDLSYALISSNRIQDNEVLNVFDGSGAGVYATRSAPTVAGNVLTRNHARYGSAIYGLNSTMLIRGNLIESNFFYNTYPLPLYLGSVNGAVTLLGNEAFAVEGNTIRGNTAAQGAGIYAAVYRAGRIENNVVVGNRAYEPPNLGGLGGGIYCLVTTSATETVRIVNNTIVSNTAAGFATDQGGGIAVSLVPPANQLVLANNLIVSNSSGIFQMPTTPMSLPILQRNNLVNTGPNYINLSAGPDDFSLVPQFVDVTAGDFRLASGSPGIDSGTNNWAPMRAFDDTPRPLDSNADGTAIVDVGAFEHVAAEADSDGDGMPDGWEIEHGLDPTLADADADADHDGARNWQEHTAGTHPLRAESVLRLAMTMGAAFEKVTLRWEGMGGRRYAVEASSTLAGEAGWQVITNALAGLGGPIELDVPLTGQSEQFYRVRVE